MAEESLDNVKQQKLAQLKKQMEDQKSQHEQAARAQMQIQTILNQYLEPAAKDRMNNIKLVNPEAYSKVVQTIMYLVQSQKISRKISDSELKRLLSLAAGPKREIKIVRK